MNESELPDGKLKLTWKIWPDITRSKFFSFFQTELINCKPRLADVKGTGTLKDLLRNIKEYAFVLLATLHPGL
jgi:hypothetical protein